MDMRGRYEWNWAAEHASWIAEWDDRQNRVVGLVEMEDATSGDYYDWYYGITRRWISRTGAIIRYMADFIHHIPDMPPEDTVASARDVIRVVDEFMALNINDPAAAVAEEPQGGRAPRGRRGRGRQRGRGRGRGRGHGGQADIRDEPSPQISHHDEPGPSFVTHDEPGPSSSSYSPLLQTPLPDIIHSEHPTPPAPQKRRPSPSHDLGEGLTQLEPDPVPYPFPRSIDAGGDGDETITQVDPATELHQQQAPTQLIPFRRTFVRHRRQRRNGQD